MLQQAKVVCIHEECLPSELASVSADGKTITVNDITEVKDSTNLDKIFTFDHVWERTATDGLRKLGNEIADSIVDGNNATSVSIGCGQDCRLFYGAQHKEGLDCFVWFPVEQLFDNMQSLTKNLNGAKQWSVDVTFIEIYSDQYYDLLLKKEVQQQNSHLPSNTLKLRSQPELGKFIEGAQQVTISSSKDFQKVLQTALSATVGKEDISARSAVLKISLRVFDITSDTTTSSTYTIIDLGVPFRFGRNDLRFKGPSAKKLIASYTGIKNLLQTIRSTPIVAPAGQRPKETLVHQYNGQRRDAKRTSALTNYAGDDIDGNTIVYAFGLVSISLENFDTELKLLSLLQGFTHVCNEVKKEDNIRKASSTAVQLKNEISRLKRELEKCEESSDDDDEELLNKTIHMYSAEVQLEVFQTQVDELNKVTATQRSQVSEVELQCVDQRKRLDTINNKLMQMQNISDATFETEQDIDVVVEDRLQAENELREQYAMTRHASLRIKQVRGSLCELETTADDYEKQKQQLADSHKVHKEEIAAGIFKRVLLEHKFGCESKALSGQVKRTRVMLNVASAKSSLRQKKIEQCVSETGALEDSKSALEVFLEGLLKTDEVEAAEAELAALMEVVRLQESQLSITTRELLQVTDETAKVVADVETLANELKTSDTAMGLDAMLARETEADLTLGTVEQQIAAQDADEEQLQSELAQLGEEIDDLNLMRHGMEGQERQVNEEIDGISAAVDEATMLLDISAVEHERLADQLEVELMDSAVIQKSYHQLCNTTAAHVLPS